jgi:ribosomal protein L29
MTDAQFEELFEELKAQNTALRADMNAHFEDVKARFDDVKAETASLRANMNAQFEGVHAQNASLRAEMNSQFEDVKQGIEGNTVKIGLAFEAQHERFARIESRLAEGS